MLQAHCVETGREIRMRNSGSGRRKFARNQYGDVLTIPLIELMRLCPDVISNAAFENIEFLIGIRNRVQHDVGSEIDALIAPKIQANVLTFKAALSTVGKGIVNIESDLPYALQFSELSIQQTKQLLTGRIIPRSLKTFILTFEGSMTSEDRQSSEYQACVKLQVVNKERGKDLEYVEVLGIGSKTPDNNATTYLKEVEKEKFTPSAIVKMMADEGFSGFGIHQHTELWKTVDGKNPKHGYGYEVAGRWLWYERWINEVVRHHCEKHFAP